MIRNLHDNKGTIGYLGKCTTRRTILVTASSLSLVVNKPTIIPFYLLEKR